MLYHLLVLLHVAGVPFDDGDGGACSGGRRETGLEEKAAQERRLMDQVMRTSLSPYRVFSIEEWAKLRADTPMTLTAEEIVALRSLGDPVSLDEVERVYLPISRLLSFYVDRDAGALPRHPALPRHQRREGALHHRHRRVGGGRQIDHGARAPRASAALAVRAEGRPRHHRRLPLPERGARRPKG